MLEIPLSIWLIQHKELLLLCMPWKLECHLWVNRMDAFSLPNVFRDIMWRILIETYFPTPEWWAGCLTLMLIRRVAHTACAFCFNQINCFFLVIFDFYCLKILNRTIDRNITTYKATNLVEKKINQTKPNHEVYLAVVGCFWPCQPLHCNWRTNQRSLLFLRWCWIFQSKIK